jgi:hypothetical protein
MNCCDILPQGLLKSPGSTLGRKQPRVPVGFATLPGVLTKSTKDMKMRPLGYPGCLAEIPQVYLG